MKYPLLLQVLIEKEWLSFGHKFSHRIGHGEDKHNDNDRSPVFLQFVDCVWQVLSQFSHAFEFNEQFLTFLLDHLYSCLFGTFLYNSDKERSQNDIKKHTQSLWSFVNQKRDMFLNPLYNPNPTNEEGRNHVIFPDSSPRHMRFWSGYYCRWNPRMRPQDCVKQRQTQLLAINDQLKTKYDALKKDLMSKRKTTSRHDHENNGQGGNGGGPGLGSAGGPPYGAGSNGVDAMVSRFESVNI